MESEVKMPYAVLEKEIERLDETQRNTVALFVRFLLSQKAAAVPAAAQSSGDSHRGHGDSFWNAFMSAKADVAEHIDHEWTMDEIDAEIAAARKERRERRPMGA